MSGPRILTTTKLKNSKNSTVRKLKADGWFYRESSQENDQRFNFAKTLKLHKEEPSKVTVKSIEESTAQFVKPVDERDAYLEEEFNRSVFIEGRHKSEFNSLDEFLDQSIPRAIKSTFKKFWDQHAYSLGKDITASAIGSSNKYPMDNNYKANVKVTQGKICVRALTFENAAKDIPSGTSTDIKMWLIPGTIMTSYDVINGEDENSSGLQLSEIVPSNFLQQEFCEKETVELTEEKIRQAQREEITALNLALSKTQDEPFQLLGKKILELIQTNQINKIVFKFNPYNTDPDFIKIQYLYDVVSVTRQLIEDPFNQTLFLVFSDLSKKADQDEDLKALMQTCAANVEACQKAYVHLTKNSSTLAATIEAQVRSDMQDIEKLKSVAPVSDLTRALQSLQSNVINENNPELHNDHMQNVLFYSGLKQAECISRLEKLLAQSEDEKLKDFGRTFLDTIKILLKKSKNNLSECIILFKALDSINRLIANPFDQHALANLRTHVKNINNIPQIKAAIDSHISGWNECQKAYTQLKQVLTPESTPDTPENKSVVIEPKFQTQAQRVFDEAVKLKSILAVSDLTQLMKDTRTLITEPLQTFDALTPRYKEQADKLSKHSQLKTAMGTLAFVVGAAVMVASASAIMVTLGASTPFSFLGFTLGAGLLGLASWLGVSSTVALGVSAVAATLGFTSAAGGGVTFFKNVTKTKLAKEMNTLVEMTQDNGDDDLTPETPEVPVNPRSTQ